MLINNNLMNTIPNDVLLYILNYNTNLDKNIMLILLNNHQLLENNLDDTFWEACIRCERIDLLKISQNIPKHLFRYNKVKQTSFNLYKVAIECSSVEAIKVLLKKKIGNILADDILAIAIKSNAEIDLLDHLILIKIPLKTCHINYANNDKIKLWCISKWRPHYNWKLESYMFNSITLKDVKDIICDIHNLHNSYFYEDNAYNLTNNEYKIKTLIDEMSNIKISYFWKKDEYLSVARKYLQQINETETYLKLLYEKRVKNKFRILQRIKTLQWKLRKILKNSTGF